MSVGAIGGGGAGAVSPVGASPASGDAMSGTGPVSSGTSEVGASGGSGAASSNLSSCDSSMSTETFSALKGAGSVDGQDPMMESVKKLVELMLMLKMLEMMGQQ